MTFRVGQKVVCVDAATVWRGEVFLNADGVLKRSDGDMGGLKKGRIYTIQAIYLGKVITTIVLNEIASRGPDDQGFRISRFRPVVERKTDISFAHEILRKASKRVRA